jgi:hypothetical protein
MGRKLLYHLIQKKEIPWMEPWDEDAEEKRLYQIIQEDQG